MLKIVYTDKVDTGIPDHLVSKTCRQVLDRLAKRPQEYQAHRTGQRLVWDTFQYLIGTDYQHLQEHVDFEDNA
jgi:hypothetical protein